MESSRMFRRVKWPKCGLWCPMGKVRTRPTVEVTLSPALPPIPFREVDRQVEMFAAGCKEATHESAALTLAGIIFYEFERDVTVRVGEADFWAEATIGGESDGQAERGS